MMVDTRFFAHTLAGRPQAEWQELLEHLTSVGEGAARHALIFNAAGWARLAGLWHDLGKYSKAFQDYLTHVSSPDPHIADGATKTDHSTAGAQHAVSALPVVGHLLAFVIAGHHSGLLDARGEGPCLEARLRKEVEPCEGAPDALLAQPAPELPPFLRDAFARRDAFSIAFFSRMIFSCLVDADFLDTESFMRPDQAAERPAWSEDILVRMAAALERHMDDLRPNPTPINRQRGLVLQACLDAAERPTGLFSLTVPTGGGKTLSSLAFALKHAIDHDLRRVIYVVPFTSIIEQNAEIFRQVMQPLRQAGVIDPVVEHHSNLDVGEETMASRLATENWDAPLVVTTSVQFYESLFANRTSRCRKLHNLARAVVILDEAQVLPVDYLGPCLRALDELSKNYGTSVVLCTATQPAIQRRDEFPIGLKLESNREIIPDPKRLYRALKRVEVQVEGTLTDSKLTLRLLREERVLCVVNTRGHARRLFEALGDEEDHFHLSALMCPAHRTEVLARIRRRLDSGEGCRVISTQLIEAGVDIDFPVVYRSMAGLDSIAQAAGRCNRNGTLESGRTVVFRSEHDRSERFLAETANSARQVLPLHEDPLSIEAVEHYFRLYYWDQSSRWDAKTLLAEFHLAQDRRLPFLFNFSTVAERFRLIEDSGAPVIIPWGDEGEALCRELRRSWEVPSPRLRRRLQRYTVHLPLRIWKEHSVRAFELVHDRYPVLLHPDLCYSERTGLKLETDVTEAYVI